MMHPFELFIEHPGGIVFVDLDEPSWLQREDVRAVQGIEAMWVLRRRLSSACLVMAGQGIAYEARHIGIASGVGVVKNEVVAYGLIGPGRSIWAFLNGYIVSGEQDMEALAIQLLKSGNVT
jgi:hypothetical protein